jgi:hypothetical protein
MKRISFFLSTVLCLSGTLLAQQSVPPATTPTPASPISTDNTVKPRVFITDSQSWETRSSAGGGNGAFAASSAGGARPQTTEIIKTFGERCPGVRINNKQELADYIVTLDHEGGKGLFAHKDKVAVFARISGDLVMSHSTLSVGGSVKDACDGIEKHWQTNSSALIGAADKEVAEKAAKQSAPKEAIAIAAPAQASLIIDSTPIGADIEIDGGFVGNTPSTLSLAPGSHEISVKKKGYTAWTRKLNVTGGNIHLNADLDKEVAPQ